MISTNEEGTMKYIEQARRILISEGERRLRVEMPEKVRTDSHGLRIWNILAERDRELIRVGIYGTDEEVREMRSTL
jgi:hypothetical protein